MSRLSLAAAGPADRDRILAWANDPRTRAASFDPHVIGPAEHAAWFAERLTDPRTRLYVARSAGEPVGLVRFALADDGRWELGVNLASASRGRGLGAELIELGLDALAAELGRVEVFARTRPDNLAFLRAAERAGFGPRGPTRCRGQAALELVHPPVEAGTPEES